ncbi:P-loop containing nucleoside triphosphate hydrolase protein [Suillus paluster]|uniref:P-loop containing nucleoside triphosphate hydrolase protein n=1 Tax=Suillus paluster TaxID=48578 RepID=UPI001B85B977|nr:P-loop containing nucleoside triphosphate hydrolase protein [Suillus paluster]KAG1744672.1 P-loop containing nucleoside triphosphate hydrolase protein [Suillus paluster]
MPSLSSMMSYVAPRVRSRVTQYWRVRGVLVLHLYAPCITTPNPPQSAPVFPGSLHENVALGTVGKGKRTEDVSRGEVEEAVQSCDARVLGARDFAIARARIRDPDVLILDEATSALDPPTRALIMAAIRRWRQNRTIIIIITHDVASIEEQDFVYVMREGSVVEQGFRSDLLQAG